MEILSKIISPATIILTGAILVALGGFWAGVRNNAIQNKLQEKTEEISKLNKHIVASVTGGDTYPYIRVEFAHIPRGLVILTLMSEGENPLYDVGVNLIDSDKYKFKDDIAYAEYLKRLKGGIDEGRKSMRIGNFRPNEVRNLSSFMMEDENGERNFTDELIARNGFFKQKIKIIKENGKLRAESEIRNGDSILKKLE